MPECTTELKRFAPAVDIPSKITTFTIPAPFAGKKLRERDLRAAFIYRLPQLLSFEKLEEEYPLSNFYSDDPFSRVASERADLALWLKDNSILLIEIKPTLNYTALGQALAYKTLSGKAGIVYHQGNEILEYAAIKHNIALFKGK